jgi:hypothetical protein
MPAPVASGWSESPGGACTHWKAPPCHGAHPKQSLAAADHSAFSAMEQHKPELNRKSRVDRCLQLCFISNSKLSWGGDIGNDDQNRAFEQAGFGVL